MREWEYLTKAYLTTGEAMALYYWKRESQFWSWESGDSKEGEVEGREVDVIW